MINRLLNDEFDSVNFTNKLRKSFSFLGKINYLNKWNEKDESNIVIEISDNANTKLVDAIGISILKEREIDNKQDASDFLEDCNFEIKSYEELKVNFELERDKKTIDLIEKLKQKPKFYEILDEWNDKIIVINIQEKIILWMWWTNM